jgi:hypothetical protein
VSEDPSILGDVAMTIQHALEDVYPESPIPLTVSTRVGKRWGSMKNL